MIQISINGRKADICLTNTLQFTDLLELVKAQIDPEHMITAITMDGRELTDEEWNQCVSQLQGHTLEILTGHPDVYVSDKLQDASRVVRSCFFEFRDARKGFQDGDTVVGNKRLKTAVDTLKAFFDWYGTLVQLVSETKRGKLDISPQVVDISETCKKICQQQIYQSWWALGESLEKELEPKLDKLEDACRRVAREIQTAAPQ
ncbi:MAG: hypothetical protein ACK5GN_09395 [Pseudomonadota bacterium]|jgi:hypothetical protein